MKAPCKDCTRRTALPNCHASCPDYRAFNEEREAIREQRRRESEVMDALVRNGEKARARLARQKRSNAK